MSAFAEDAARLRALRERIEVVFPRPADLVDAHGVRWSYWKGDLWRDGTGRAWPRHFLDAPTAAPVEDES